MTKFDAKNQATGEVIRFEDVPVDVSTVLDPGTWILEEVVAPEYTVNVLEVSFATAPLVSGSSTAGATLTVSGTATAALAYEFRWLVEGVLIPGATAATHTTDALLDLGKTFVGEMRAQDARGRWTAWTPSSNSITIPAPLVFTIADNKWTGVEATSDLNNRKTTVDADCIGNAPPTGVLYWYKGTNPLGNLAQVSAMTDDLDGTFSKTSNGTEAVGVTVYVRLAYWNVAKVGGAGYDWCSSVKNYVSSNVPAAPGAFVATNSTTVSGRVSLDPNDTPPATNGRAILEYGYSQNGGAVVAFASGGTATTARDVDFPGIDPITVRVHARNVNGWSLGSASQTVTPPLIVAGVNTTAPTMDSSFYGQAWYEVDDGVWTGDPTFTRDLEQSDDGSTGWTSTTAAWVTATSYTVGMRRTNSGSTYVCLVDHTSGTFATDLSTAKWLLTTASVGALGNLPKGQLDSKYVRVKITPSLGSAAYSAAYLVRPSYSYVLRFNPTNTGIAANIDRTVSMPFLGYELTTGGIWMQGFVYWDGTDGQSSFMGLGSAGSSSSNISMRVNNVTVTSGSAYSVGLSAIATSVPEWYLATGWVRKVGGTVFYRLWRNEAVSAEGSQALALTLATSGYNTLRLGNRAANNTSNALKTRACGFSVGTGDPSAFHDWVYNGGKFRNPLDYNFGTDPLGATMGFHERGYRVGSATWAAGDMVDEIGSLDTATNNGGSVPSWNAPTDVLPPFIKATGPAPTVPEGFISPAYVFAGTQQSFQFNGAVGKIVEGSLSASPWVTATSYAIGARVTQGGVTYICVVDHTSGTFATDLTAVRWKNYTVTSLTHTGWPVGSMHCPEGSTGLGDISGTITNGIFTCSTPGTLSADVNIGGVSLTLTGAIYPAVAMPATPRDATLFNGNGLVAAFEPYPAVGAGTTYASAAALGTDIGAMAAGTTLIVEDLSDSASTLTIPARDYGGAVVVAKNLHGVDVNSINCSGVRNLTLRGFECVVRIGSHSGSTAYADGVDGLWLDHCKAARINLSAYSATSILRVTNFQTPETGLTFATSFYKFQTLVVQRAAWGDSADTLDGDIVRVDNVERHIVKRVYVGNNDCISPTSHPDAWQTVGTGPNGFNCGIYEDVVVIDRTGARGTQGLFMSDNQWRDLLVNRCSVVAQATYSLSVGVPQWNISLLNCVTSNVMEVNSGIANAGFAKNNVMGSAGKVLKVSGTEIGTLSLADAGVATSTVFPQSNTYPLSWRRWANPGLGYGTVGPATFIAELEAKRVALGI